jgi:hypothetical protein
MWPPAIPYRRLLDSDTGHELGLFDRGLHRVDRCVQVDDDALPQPAGRRRSKTDDVHGPVVLQLHDDA